MAQVINSLPVQTDKKTANMLLRIFGIMTELASKVDAIKSTSNTAVNTN